ncbi:ester cyclase [Draconibacterium sp.]|nr:ester cyclase [Draconibacterium sp.]
MENKNKELINVFTEDFWNKHNMGAYEKYFTTDFVAHYADGDYNFEQYKGICQAYFTAFPDLHITTNDLLAEGDKVTKVWTANCTHNGELMGIPATGKQIEVKGIEVLRIADGKIAENWVSMDNLGMMQQIGVIPPMG